MNEIKPPDWFVTLFGVLCSSYPTWPCTSATVSMYWVHLQDLPRGSLASALAAHIASSNYAPSIAEWRSAVKAASTQPSGEITAGEAWDEMYRNRRRCGTGPLAIIEKAKWSSEAVRRAAQAVDWTSPDWLTDQIPTLRAQFERYYNALKGKQDRIDAYNELEVFVAQVSRAVGGSNLEQLYGRGYRDPAPEPDDEKSDEGSL